MIYTAAGLNTVGWRPVAYSIASFATAWPFEQISLLCELPELTGCYHRSRQGYLYSTSGSPHHAADDLALMSVLPGMTVVAPGDPNEVIQLFPQLFNYQGLHILP